MTNVNRIRQAVEMAAESWPPFNAGDSNLVDVYWLAEKIRQVFAVVVPAELPPKSVGVEAFECVEGNLLLDPRHRVLRNISSGDLAQRLVNLAGAIKRILRFSEDQNLVASLYMWHGCISMGKLLRCVYNVPGGQALYTPQMRRDEYAHIQQDWNKVARNRHLILRYTKIGFRKTRPIGKPENSRHQFGPDRFAGKQLRCV